MTAPHENGRSEAPVERPLTDDEIDLRQIAGALRRRWWIVGLCSLAFLLAGWLHQQRQIPRYTATTLLQKEARQSPLDAFSSPLLPSRSDPRIGSEIALLFSRALLGPVVDSLGLRVRITEPKIRRGVALMAVEAGPEAVPGEYLLVTTEDGGLSLVNNEMSHVFWEDRPGNWVNGPGFRLLAADSIGTFLPVGIQVVHIQKAVDALRRRISAEQLGETSLIRISYTDPDPALAAAVVRELASTYQEHAARKARQDARRRRIFIAGQLAVVLDSLQSAQLQQLAYQEQSGTLDPQTEGQALIRAVMEAEAEVRLQLYHETILVTLNQALNAPGETDEALRRTVALGGQIIPGAETMYARLQDLQAERSRLTASRFGYTSEGAEVEVVDSLIAATKGEMRAISEQALNVVRARRANAEDRVADLRLDVRRLPERSTKFLRLQQQVAAIQSTYDLLAEKYYEAQIAENVEGGDVEIVDPPVVPVFPESSHPLRTLILALVLGVMVGTGLGLGLEYFDRRVRGSDDAEEATGLPVLAGIPRVGSRLKGFGRPVLAPRERTPMGEAFRSLNTMIRFSRTERPRIIAVTSPEPEAGKSTVAANLALVLAQNKRRVLLIDADFPRPVQHRIFDMPRRPGLSDLLVGDATFEDVLQRHTEHEIDFISAGSPVPNSADLLTSEAFRDVVALITREYDGVVVDTSPAMVLADSAALAPMMDGLLLVVRVGRTDRDALTAAAEQLRRVGGSLLGLVLNDVPESDSYGGYRYHEYFQSENGKEASGVVNRIRKLIRA